MMHVRIGWGTWLSCASIVGLTGCMSTGNGANGLVNFCDVFKGRSAADGGLMQVSAASGGQLVDYPTQHPVGTLVVDEATGSIHVVREGDKALFYPAKRP